MFTRVGGEHTGDPWPGWLLGESDSDSSRRRRRLHYYRGLDWSGMQELAGVVASRGLPGWGVFVREAKGKRKANDGARTLFPRRAPIQLPRPAARARRGRLR